MMFEMRAALRRPSPLHDKRLFTALHTHIHMHTLHALLLELTNMLLLTFPGTCLCVFPLSGFLHITPRILSMLIVKGWEPLLRRPKQTHTDTHTYKHLPCEGGWRALASSAEQTR